MKKSTLDRPISHAGGPGQSGHCARYLRPVQCAARAARVLSGNLYPRGGDPRLIILFILLLPLMVIWELAKKS